MYTVYSKPACPMCNHAKALLQSKGLPFNVIHLDVGQPKDEAAKYISRDALIAKIPPTARTMPQIFKGDEYIGGFEELKTQLS